VISIFAPEGIGEVRPGDDLADLILEAIDNGDHGPLQDGDVLVVTSKIVSKAEDRYAAAEDRFAVIDSETVRTVARRKSFAIVETHHGLTQAGAGVDNSNVDSGRILLLPADPDASAEGLRMSLAERTGLRIGVIISDTSGRIWRIGQTDHAIGAAGVQVVNSYAGRTDAYGNQLEVTAMAVGDELAAAADLAKSKLSARPVAVIRGVADQVVEPGPRAADLQRPGTEDLFARGSRESVIHALLTALGHPERYEQVVRQWERDELIAMITEDVEVTEAERTLITKLIAAAQPIW
jgi:coenzyme F420-0:L-glutamate ligase/coenzyme F420-1:gamma-L-glutamate ligase